MRSRAETLFERLKTSAAILSLIGNAENADFDCKVWPDRTDAARGMLAKAACGFANATGGVIVIGMKAAGGRNGEPDVVTSAAPVSDVGAVAGAALDVILQQVEPGIEGVQVRQIRDGVTEQSGFVLVFVPETTGSPRRGELTGNSMCA